MMSTKVKPLTESGIYLSKDIAKTFETLRWYLRLCGYYFERDRKNGHFIFRCRQTLMGMYCALCTCCALFNAFRFVFVYQNVSNYSASLLTSLAYTCFYIEVACLAVTMNLTLPRNFEMVIQHLGKRYWQDSKRRPKLLVITYVSFGVLLFFALLFHVVKIVLHETLLPALPRFHAPFDKLDGSYKYIGTFLDSTTASLGSFGFYVMIIVYDVISYCIYKEFAIYSETFKELYQGPKDIFELKFQDLWDDHVSICDILHQAEKNLKHFVAITYLGTIPTFCFLVYGLIQGRLPVEEFALVAIILGVCVFQMANITLFGIVINDKAHEPLQHIFHSKWTCRSDETIHKISLLVARFSTEKIGYSVYGLFTIDRSTILMCGSCMLSCILMKNHKQKLIQVCGTVLTYAVVVLQLQTDKPTDSQCVRPDFSKVNITQLCSLC